MAPRHTILLCIFLVGFASADFSPNFKSYIITNYGQAMYDSLARNDLGAVGSYGGGTHDGNSPTSRRAVILVHGITNNAGNFFGQRDALLSDVWTPETVYLTTYGSGSATVTPAQNVAMDCAFVQQMRNFIKIVAAFTKQPVDILGYSLGSPIVRKAILGGTCAENSTVNLGAPLTSSVVSYVSIAGANRATYLCPFTFPTACNSVNGLNCKSKFLVNINGQIQYEGSYIYSIYGPNDDKVGYSNIQCATINSEIDGYYKQYNNATGNHDAILSGTINLQIAYLKGGVN